MAPRTNFLTGVPASTCPRAVTFPSAGTAPRANWGGVERLDLTRLAEPVREGQDSESWSADEAGYPTQVSASSPSRRLAHDLSGLQGKRAVICEDEAVTQMQLRRALNKAGMAVVGIATNGRDAVEITLRERPDIVLMDIRMPVMDGIAATRIIMDHY